MSNIEIFGAAAPVTMTSKEIADLTDKEHKNVLRDIRILLVELHGAAQLASLVPESHRNRPSEYIRENADALLSAIFGDGSNLSHQDLRGFSWERDARGYIASFSLDKTHTLTLISGYSVTLRHRIIERWKQLEAEAADPAKALNDPATLRHVLLGYTEKVIALENQVQDLKPKAGALDRIVTGSDGSFCLTDAAKALQVQPRKFLARLQQMGWIYRRPMGSSWLAYQDRLTVGLMEHKVTTGEKSDGSEWTSTQVRVTAKGMARLALLIEKEPVPA